MASRRPLKKPPLYFDIWGLTKEPKPRSEKDPDISFADILRIAAGGRPKHWPLKDKNASGTTLISSTKGEAGGKSDRASTAQEMKFTPQQDATLLRMKEEGKSWADIGAEIGKTKGVVTRRLRELQGQKKDAELAKKTDEGNPLVGGPSRAEDPKEEFTKEQDAMILSMKGEGKNWGEIAAKVAKSKKLVTKRFGELHKEKKEAGGGDKWKTAQKKDSKKESRENGKPDEDNGKEDARVHQWLSRSREGVDLDNWYLDDKERFNADERDLLKRLIREDEGRMSLRVSSRFFDITGRRLEAEFARKCPWHVDASEDNGKEQNTGWEQKPADIWKDKANHIEDGSHYVPSEIDNATSWG